MMHTCGDLEKLPADKANNLLYLRLLRDNLAKALAADFQDGEELTDAIMRWDSPALAYYRMREFYIASGLPESQNKLTLFLCVCRRIARIERERLGAYVELSMQDA